MRLVVKNRPGSRTTGTLMAPTGNRTTETLMERRRTFAYGARRLSATPVVETVGPTVGEIYLDRYILRSLSSLLPPCHTIDPPPPSSFEPSHLSTAGTSAVAPLEISVASAVAPLGTSLDCQFVGPTVGEIDLDRYILRSLSSLLPPCHTILRSLSSLLPPCHTIDPPPPSFEPSYLSTADTSAVATFEISVASAVW